MKNALKFVAGIVAFLAFWYVTFGWRISTEPLKGVTSCRQWWTTSADSKSFPYRTTYPVGVSLVLFFNAPLYAWVSCVWVG